MSDTAAEVIAAAQALADVLGDEDVSRLAADRLHRLEQALLTHERLSIAKESS